MFFSQFSITKKRGNCIERWNVMCKQLLNVCCTAYRRLFHCVHRARGSEVCWKGGGFETSGDGGQGGRGNYTKPAKLLRSTVAR